jgi:hypothetical protein
MAQEYITRAKVMFTKEELVEFVRMFQHDTIVELPEEVAYYAEPERVTTVQVFPQPNCNNRIGL